MCAIRTTSGVAAGLALAMTSFAGAAEVVLPSSPADFEIRRELNTFSPNFGNLTTQAQAADTLDVWYAGGESEYRAFAEFDLAALAGQGPTIASAQLVAYRTFSSYPNGSVAVLGATANRADVLSLASPATLDEFASPAYTVLSSSFAPNVAPNAGGASFSLDVTAYLQARYNDYLADPTLDTVILRLQSPGSVGTDIRFASGDNATAGNRMRLEVNVVPEPSTAMLVAGAAAMTTLRRRTRSSGRS